MHYRPAKFASLFNTSIGEALWDFLNDDGNVIRMETATYLRCPAVEPLSPFLHEKFGEEVRKDRVKQMIGHMVRQIIESKGYSLDQSNVRIRTNGNIFKRATRYKKLS